MAKKKENEVKDEAKKAISKVVSSKKNTSKKADSIKKSTVKKNSVKKEATLRSSTKTASKAKTATTKTTSKSKASTSKASTKIKASVANKAVSKSKTPTDKVSSKAKTKATAKTASKSKTSTSKTSSKVKDTATKSVVKKDSTKSAKKTSSKTKSTSKKMLVEYYDLPYGYNETTVKILAQTPTTLFVYWDISEEDRNNLTAKYGENFFYESKPILIVHNLTKHYSFEIEINDFANSWYIRCQEPNCDYTIELGRKILERPEEYVYIDSSNDIVSPNDHILFENVDLGHIKFRNVKTGTISEKDFGSLRFINNIDKLYGNIYDVYSALYKDETLNELANPTSGEFIMMR